MSASVDIFITNSLHTEVCKKSDMSKKECWQGTLNLWTLFVLFPHHHWPLRCGNHNCSHAQQQKGGRGHASGSQEGGLDLAIQGMSAISVYSPPPNVSDMTKNSLCRNFGTTQSYEGLPATALYPPLHHPPFPPTPPFQLPYFGFVLVVQVTSPQNTEKCAVQAHF